MRKIFIALCLTLLGLCAVGLAVLHWGTKYGRYPESSATNLDTVSLTAALTDVQMQKERNLARWYNLALRAEKPDAGFLSAYLQILDFRAGKMGYLEFPGLALTQPIIHETGNEQASGEIVHQFGTSLPVGGRGNCPVLRCGGDGKIVAVGDEFYIHILDSVLTYQVAETGSKMPQNRKGEDLCVLWFSSEDGAYYVTGVRTTEILAN